jgi:hypothetical protein
MKTFQVQVCEGNPLTVVRSYIMEATHERSVAYRAIRDTNHPISKMRIGEVKAIFIKRRI